MNKLFAARNLIKYHLRAGTPNDVHSPFVFELYTNVIIDKTPYYSFRDVESLRALHLLDQRKINVTDFGTGKRFRQESICEIARKSLKPEKYAQLLFRLVNRFQPASVLELGTALGLSTIYLSLPVKNNRVITLEGCPEISTLAQQNFTKLNCQNIELLTGEFSETLPAALQKLPSLDFVFFDGNHSLNATLGYFNLCLQQATKNSVFVFDDIHWSREMEKAWNTIQENPEVTLTIDLFQLGIVFFRTGAVKQHFTLRF